MATLEEALVLECNRLCQTSSDEALTGHAGRVLCQIELWRYIRGLYNIEGRMSEGALFLDIKGYSLHQLSSRQKEIFTSQCDTGSTLGVCGQLVTLLSQVSNFNNY